MCGIVGLWYKDPARSVVEPDLRAMCARIVHRGPDDEGLLVDGSFGMGMRRLSIIDLAGGHQPIFNEDGTVATVFNGEIFNYPELRSELEGAGHVFRTRSDTESLVHGYEVWGDDLPRHLNGMFAFSVWDAKRRRLLLARDHVGVKPLYVYEDEDVFAWASEVKALLALPFIEPALDHLALIDFLTFGYVPAPRTLFAGIQKLPPATLIVAENGEVRRSEYWRLGFQAEHRSINAWSDELRDLLDDAIKRQLMSDVPLGAFLSGGIDSTAIVSSMHGLGVEKISTYAIGFGAEDAYHNETAKAALVADRLRTDHHEILVEPDVAGLMELLVWHLDEPVTDTSFIVSYLVSKLARESVKVILSGVGGDEVFGGYRRYQWPQIAKFYDFLPGFVDRGVVRPLANSLPADRGSAGKAFVRYLRGYLEHADLPDPERYQGYVRIFRDKQIDAMLSPALLESRTEHTASQVADAYRSAQAEDPLGRMLFADLKTSLVDSLLAFTDKMSMAVSLEARVPLLDYRLLELAARMPSEIKLRGFRGYKHILKHALSDRIPPELVNQRKQGFGTPISRWFRAGLRDYVGDVLSKERIRQRGLFDPNEVSRIVDAHMTERADHSEHILAMIMIEIWHRIFIDGGGARP